MDIIGSLIGYSHIVTNHFPSIGMMILMIFLVVGYITKNPLMIKVSLFVVFLLSVIGIWVFFSGYQAMYNLLPFTENMSAEDLSIHITYGTITFIIILITGILSLLTNVIYFKKDHIPLSIVIVFIILGLAIIFLSIVTSYFGGNITHEELREFHKNVF